MSLEEFWEGTRQYDERKSLTFTAAGRDLGERVIAAVTLATYDPRLTLTLTAVPVTRTGERAHGVTVAQQTRVTGRRPEVIVLRRETTRYVITTAFWNDV